jgi:hypothetical protein
MFGVPSGVLVDTRATGGAAVAARWRAITARCTGAHRETKRVEGSRRAGPGTNAGRTGFGSGSCETDAPFPECELIAAVSSPAAIALIAQAMSAVRLNP